MAPPGYAAYTAAPMGSVPLKRVGGVARAASILCLVSAALSVIELLVRGTNRDEARAFRNGELSDTEFIEAVAGYALIGFVVGILTVAAAVVTIIWMFRIASNHRSLHRGTTWGPGWAIGGWFAPPFLYIVPTLMLREMWQASDPDVPVGGDWKSRPSTLLPFAWLVLYGVIPLVLLDRRDRQRVRVAHQLRGPARRPDPRQPDALDRRRGRLGRGSHRVRPPRSRSHRPAPPAHRRSHRRQVTPAMAKLYLVRHAKAGERRLWDDDDIDRPLSAKGWKQSELLAKRLARLDVSGLHSSPYLRCVQTLEPLARRLKRPIVVEQRLREDEPFAPVLDLLAALPAGVVLSSHGDIIPATLAALERRGTEIRTPPDWRKASVWVLKRNKHGDIVHATVWPPPVL